MEMVFCPFKNLSLVIYYKSITVNYFKGMMQFKKELGISLTEEEIIKLFKAIDTDMNGIIDYSGKSNIIIYFNDLEFIACFCDNILYKNERLIK